MLEQFSSLTPFVIGTVIGALIVMPFALVYRARARDASAERRRIEAVANRTRGVLSASPDGIFMWDNASGGISCSSRLADMLSLSGGTLSRYDDIRSCFAGDDLQKLEQSVSLLRAKGTPFSIVLARGEQILQALGSRAQGPNNEAVADIVWMRDITQAAQSTQAIKEGPRNTSGLDDKHLTALLDTLPIPLWLRDADLNLAFQNRAAEGIFGLDAGVGAEARASDKPVHAITEITEQGKGRRVRVTETPLAPGNGVKSGTLGFAIDADAIAPSPSAPAPVPVAAPPVDLLRPLEIGVAVFDGDTTLIAANTAFADLWRLDHDWLDTRPGMSDLLNRLRELRRLPEVADFADFRRTELSRFGGLDRVEEDELHLPDGRTLKRRFGALDDGGLVISCEDVSDHLSMQRSLKSLDRVQRTTLENMREGIAVFGGDGRLQLTNTTLRTLWNQSEEELPLGTRLAEVVQIFGMQMAANDEPWSKRKERIAAAVLARTPSKGRFDLVNGKILAFANIPLPDGASLVSYVDITDTYRVEEALRQRARTLVEADRMKTEFIANVAMEVRTPLNTIQGFADILRQELFGDMNRRQQEYAGGIVETSERMMAVVNDILDLATIDAGRMELNKDTVDPHAILVNAFNIVKEQARRKTIKIDFNCPPEIGWINADGKRLTQVVFNLLTNAINFTPKLGHITLAAARDDNWIDITVSDSGPGIPKADRQRVLEPFGRVNDDAHRAHGPGLGLTIVRRFVELHGGAVAIRSNKSRGTTVICRIPVDADSTQGVASFDADHAIVDEHAAE
ncbi:MAG: ATP-binding protein [Rhodospirillales bacterium]